jgi:hypothetical protein
MDRDSSLWRVFNEYNIAFDDISGVFTRDEADLCHRIVALLLVVDFGRVDACIGGCPMSLSDLCGCNTSLSLSCCSGSIEWLVHT